MFIEKLTKEDVKKLCGILKLEYESHSISKGESLLRDEDFVRSPLIYYGTKNGQLSTLNICHYSEWDEGPASDNSIFTDYACTYNFATNFGNKVSLGMINAVYHKFMAKKFSNYKEVFTEQQAQKTAEFKEKLTEIISLAYKKENGKTVRRKIFTQNMINEAASNLVSLLCEGADAKDRLNEKYSFLDVAKELNYHPLIEAINNFNKTTVKEVEVEQDLDLLS